jgi:hypothetical protein
MARDAYFTWLFRYRKISEQTKSGSLDYTLAGQLIAVFGLVNGGCLYPIKGKDELIQHHATSYRILLKDQIEGIKMLGCTQ